MLIAAIIFILLCPSSEQRKQKKGEDIQGKFFCLERSRLIRLDRDGEAVIVESIPGKSVHLNCSYCDEENFEPRSWAFWNLSGEPKVLETQDRVKITALNSLAIQNVSNQDAGFYFCRIPYDDSVEKSFNFLLDVLNVSSNRVAWRGDLLNWLNYSAHYLIPLNANLSESEMSNVKLQVFSKWSAWSACEICKENPLKRRTASCRVKPSPNSELSSFSPVLPENVLQAVIQTAAAFPCQGWLISKLAPDLSKLVRNIPDFIQEIACEWTCPKKGVGDRKQLILEEGGQAIVPCRGNNGRSKPRWEHNKRRINLTTMDGTAAVDRFGILHLSGVTKNSKGNYTCFSLENQRLFEVNVIVRSSNPWGFGEDFRRSAGYLAIVTVISFWIFVVSSIGFYILQKRMISSKVHEVSEDQRPLLDESDESESE